ncbi:MAG: sugar phosphate nucleotidyltransferase, partial [Deltaproteobacteria bacterium]|nr:sugar phosphate nucleotidyltransferase [Deltaproteobacteria bacterium]
MSAPLPGCHGLIVAGGSGTRLWPLSRTRTPKQLLSLSGSGLSLLQDSMTRLMRLMPAHRIHVVTGAAQASQVLTHSQALAPEFPAENVLAEPEGRDSAPAVLWGALRVHFLDPEAVLAVVWSDGAIDDPDAFEAALRTAYATVKTGGLAAVGELPHQPATSLGYIEYGPKSAAGVHPVKRFVEKPPREEAERLIAQGQVAWNPGIFMFKVKTLLEEFAAHAPQALELFKVHDSGLRTNPWTDTALIRSIFVKMPRISLDYLILEKTRQLVVVPAKMGWSDLGTWEELHRHRAKDEAGNTVQGTVVLRDTRNSLIQSSRRLVAVAGVENLVVVDTEDALLVGGLGHGQELKRLVEALKEQGRPEVDALEQGTRPWGSYSVLTEG